MTRSEAQDQVALGLIATGFEYVINAGLVLGSEQGQGLFQGLAVELELVGNGLELAPVLFVGIGLGVVDPLFLEFGPAAEFIALQLLLAVPDLRAADLGGDLTELGSIGRLLLGLWIFKEA